MSIFNSKKVNVHKEEVLDGNSIDEVSISTSSATIELSPSSSDQITVMLDGVISENIAEKYEFTVNHDKNVLDIKFKQVNSVGFNFGVLGSLVDVKLRVTLPEKVYEDIFAKTSSGGITANKFSAKKVTLKSSSGDQYISGIDASERMSVDSSSGGITASDIRTDKGKFHSSSGAMKLNNIMASNLSFEASSGDIMMMNETLAKVMDISSSSGDVDIKVINPPESLKVVSNTSSGDVRMNMDGLQVNRNSKHAITGIKGSGDYKLHIKTSSGDISLH